MQPCFFTKSVKFGFGELSICRISAESRDLQSGHGFRACSFKNKRKKLNFHEKMKVATLFCHQVGQIWSYRAVIFFPCSKSRDLQSEHGFRACSFENIRKKLDVHTFCDQKTEKATETWNELGRILVPRALNRSKKMRKTGADNFPKSSA